MNKTEARQEITKVEAAKLGMLEIHTIPYDPVPRFDQIYSLHRESVKFMVQLLAYTVTLEMRIKALENGDL